MTLAPFLQEVITRYPRLSREAEIRLGNQKDEESRRLLVLSNLPLAMKIAATNMRGTIPYEDRCAVAFKGLVLAAETFDPAKGRFSTHATWEMRKTLRDQTTNESSLIRIPAYLFDRSGERSPSEETKAARDLALSVATGQSGADSDFSVLDTVEDYRGGDGDSASDPDDRESARRAIQEAASRCLTPSQRRVLELRYFSGLEIPTMESVGVQLGCTKQNVQATERSAIKRLAAYFQQRRV